MFERFNERAQQVVELAEEEAQRLKHNFIGTEHLLLGLLRQDEGVAADVLRELNVSLVQARTEVERVVGRGDELSAERIPFTSRAMKVCELALREALSLGHNFVGTEHLLLGLVREKEGVAARMLERAFEADAEKVRNAVLVVLNRESVDAWPRSSPASLQHEVESALALFAASLEDLEQEGTPPPPELVDHWCAELDRLRTRIKPLGETAGQT